jgi:hypothetical protein
MVESWEGEGVKVSIEDMVCCCRTTTKLFRKSRGGF